MAPVAPRAAPHNPPQSAPQRALQLDQQSTMDLTLTVLQRMDPAVAEILLTVGHVTVYEFDVAASSWTRKDVEGSLFVVKRKEQPRFQFIVMNRRAPDNLIEDLLGDLEYEVQPPYILYRNRGQEVNGIWFYSLKECHDAANLFSRILNTFSRHAHPTKPLIPSNSPEYSELEAVPSEAMVDGPLEPTTPQGDQPSSHIPQHSALLADTSTPLENHHPSASLPPSLPPFASLPPAASLPLPPPSSHPPAFHDARSSSAPVPSSLLSTLLPSLSASPHEPHPTALPTASAPHEPQPTPLPLLQSQPQENGLQGKEGQTGEEAQGQGQGQANGQGQGQDVVREQIQALMDLQAMLQIKPTGTMLSAAAPAPAPAPAPAAAAAAAAVPAAAGAGAGTTHALLKPSFFSTAPPPIPQAPAVSSVPSAPSLPSASAAAAAATAAAGPAALPAPPLAALPPPFPLISPAALSSSSLPIFPSAAASPRSAFSPPAPSSAPFPPLSTSLLFPPHPNSAPMPPLPSSATACHLLESESAETKGPMKSHGEGRAAAAAAAARDEAGIRVSATETGRRGEGVATKERGSEGEEGGEGESERMSGSESERMSRALAALLQPSHGAPMLQPFPPPAPPPSLASPAPPPVLSPSIPAPPHSIPASFRTIPAPINPAVGGTGLGLQGGRGGEGVVVVVTREGLKAALLRLVQNDNFVDMLFQELAHSHPTSQ